MARAGEEAQAGILTPDPRPPILGALARGARETLDDPFLDEVWPGILERAGPHDALRETLARWAGSNAKSLVLMIDEVDALIGDTLLALLRQLRAGYPERPPRPVSAEREPVRGARRARIPDPIVCGERARRRVAARRGPWATLRWSRDFPYRQQEESAWRTPSRSSGNPTEPVASG